MADEPQELLAGANDAGRICFSATVELTAAQEPDEKPTFEMVAYTGVPMNAGGFYNPIIVELAGAKTVNAQIPILLDHDASQIVGQGSVAIDTSGIRVSGSVMGSGAEAQKVVALAKDGFKWQASIGADVTRREFLDAGKKATVNGREVTGPLIIAREAVVKEVSFTAIGADSQTSAAVAAAHSLGKVTDMDPKFAAWLEAKGFTAASLSAQQIQPLEAAWKAESVTPAAPPSTLTDVFATARADRDRQQQIADITANFLADNPFLSADEIAKVEALSEQAIKAKWSSEKYDYELIKASNKTRVFRPTAFTSGPQLNDSVLEAAVCMAGRLDGVEKMYDPQILEAAHKQFPHGIELGQIFLMCAEQNGYRGRHSSAVTLEAQRAAFGMTSPNRIQASGFSALNISSILANTANKFLMSGWNAIDMTPLRISKVRPVRDFKQITTVSLTGDLTFDKVSGTGEIKHGTLSDLTYTNQADTYARMLAITRKDLINDDLGALTEVPQRLGRGGALKLNDIFWTAWLGAVSANFIAAGNSNINTGVADMTLGGLQATETIFMNQTDPDGLPLGVQPAIVVVPTALKAAATALMSPGQNLFVTGASATIPNVNVYAGRFRVESSPYISNSSYTGYTSVGWWMIADPNDLPFVEIAALNGRVEPVVETADAEFNVLGVQMRGYSDIGVATQEKRAVVYADGGAS